MNGDAPFQSTHQAIRWAHTVEACPIVPVQRAVFGSTVANEPRLKGVDEHERHAQAAMILAHLYRHLSTFQYRVVRAKYMAPGVEEKDEACRFLAEVLRTQEWYLFLRDEHKGYHELPIEWIADQVRVWADASPVTFREDGKPWTLVDWETWLAKQGYKACSRHKLGALIYGNDRRGVPGIRKRLSGWQSDALDRAREVLIPTGLLQEGT